MLPTQKLLEQVSRKIMSVPNRQKESKRKIHYGLFLLGYKSGLRISEAVSFDLENKTKQGLYRIEKPKGKKERFVYIPKKVIGELKKQNWKPNQTNRWNFYHFLRKIKRELNISKEIELTPHTLRHAFTTYQAEKGMPLPLLQKLLGHSSIRTTALYWKNTYRLDDDNIGDILAGKRWLEGREPPKTPNIEGIPNKLPKNPEPVITLNNPEISKEKPIIKLNPPLLIKIELKSQVKSNLLVNNNQPVSNEQNKRKKLTEKEALLEKIKQLEEQLKQVQVENSIFKTLAQQEKQRADNYQRQLNSIAKILYQIQKICYYQQLERERTELEAKIIQTPPLKVK